MAEVVNSDDIGVLQTATSRPRDSIAAIHGTGVQVNAIRFSALEKGTGKYKKGWLHVYLKDLDCSILGYNLLW